jgi:hypothetical protein
MVAPDYVQRETYFETVRVWIISFSLEEPEKDFDLSEYNMKLLFFLSIVNHIPVSFNFELAYL